MKSYLIILFSSLALYGNTQIITNDTNKEEPPQKKEKKEKKEKDRTKSGVELFFGISPAYTYRTLGINDGLFAKPLGEREEEKGMWTVGYHLGARTKIFEHIKLEIGAGYYTNKEKYDFESADSVFKYVNNYQHISFPIRLAYTFGDQIQFYGGIGIIPKAFLSMSRSETALDINNKEATEKYRERDKYNLFLLDGVVTIGTQIKLSEHYGVYASIEGRRQLMNNYNSQSPYIRKAFALGFNVGIEIYL